MDDQKLIDRADKMRKDYITFNLDEKKEEMLLLDRINEILVTIFGDDTISIEYLFSPGKKIPYKWHKFKKTFLPKVFPLVLLIALTAFLVAEASLFYGDGVRTDYAIFKAVLTEVCFIFISSYRASGILESIAAFLVRIGMVALMLFVISSENFLNTTKTVENASVIAEKVLILEKQIDSKQKTIDMFLAKGWGYTVNRHEAEKSVLEKQLIALKSEQQDGANESVTKVVEYKAYGNAFFRFILLFISMLISRRFFRF
jgi:hypothetical protein